jgi:hypothetical protein
MENSMLAYILQHLEMPSIGKDRSTPPSHPVVAMVHLAVAATVHLGVAAMAATSRMVRVAVVQAVGTGTWP